MTERDYLYLILQTLQVHTVCLENILSLLTKSDGQLRELTEKLKASNDALTKAVQSESSPPAAD